LDSVRAVFASKNKQRDEEIRKIREEKDHSYVRLDIADRAPCPGLNALANQGYLYVIAPALLRFFFPSVALHRLID